MKSLQLAGVNPPMVTPFKADETIDEEAMRREINHVIDAGIDSLTIAGSTGEGHTLTVEETVELAKITVSEVKGRVPVICGVIQDSTRAAIRYGLALRDTGVDALQITPVHYSQQPGQEGNFAFFRDLDEALKMPLVIYNVVRWNMIEVPTLMRLTELESIVAVKQSGGDAHMMVELLRTVHDTGNQIRVLSALDDMLWTSFMLGAHGTVAAIVNAAPRQCVALWRAHQAADFVRAREIHEQLMPLAKSIGRRPRKAWMKAALAVQGRNVGMPRRPLLPVTDEEMQDIRVAVEISGEMA